MFPQVRQRRRIVFIIVMGIFLVLSRAITACGIGPRPLSSPLVTPTTDMEATKQADMQMLETQWSRTSSPSEMATAQALATSIMATAEVATPYPTVFPTDILPVTPAGAGVISLRPGPFSPMDYRIENTWYEDTQGGSRRTYIYAGARSGGPGDAAQMGVVIVRVLEIFLLGNETHINTVQHTAYLTPCQGGPVRVVDALGQTLTLLSASGHTFTFDVPSRQFVPPPHASPSPTPNPATDRTFTGSVDTGTTDPPPCATLTLYQQMGRTWQPLAQTTPSADGSFTLRAPGPRPPSRFLLSMQYPPGFAPALPLAGPGFVVVDAHTIMSVSALGPGEYGGQRFRSLALPPSPGTPTPPPLPTPPPGTWTPPPTSVSPLATPRP
mgnify:CR=1 FL=1